MLSYINNKRGYLLLSVITGILLWAAWPPHNSAFLLFIAFIPLLWIEKQIYNQKPSYSYSSVFKYSYLAFLTWNTLTTYWIWHASPGGAIMAILANTLLMSITFVLFHITKKYMGKTIGIIAFVVYWLTFEYIHFNWEAAWPWLTLGNGLSVFPKWIQWYEYTGTAGGSLWILLINIIIFNTFNYYKGYKNAVANIRQLSNKHIHKIALAITVTNLLLIIIVPLVLSFSIYNNYKEKGVPLKVSIIQPNIDPYNEKFSGLSEEQQLEILFSLSLSTIDSSTDYLIWPETSLPENIWLDDITSYQSINKMKELIAKYPNLKIVTGISAYKHYDSKEELTPTARKYQDGECCYDVFNSAIQIDSSNTIPFYHKSKLVPGVERIPYPQFFKFLESWAINLGGISGSLGMQNERTVFFSEDSIGIAPVICYESVFGDYVTGYIINGAQLIFIMTNDGWWKRTSGYQQHLHYASLRAIETRRSIARSANTGISCFINQKGEIAQATKFWEQAVIDDTILANKEMTFFTRNGDYLSRISVFLSVIFLLLTFVSAKTKKFKYRL